MKFYLLDKDENIIDNPPSKDILSLFQDIQSHKADSLSGSLILDKRYTEKLDDVRYFAISDRNSDHNFWLYRKTILQVQNKEIVFNGIGAFYDDLKGYGYIKEKRPNNITSVQALHLILDNTRWNIDYVDDRLNSELHDGDFYYLPYLDCFSKILETWAVDVEPYVNIEGNKITRRYVNLYYQQGGNNGRRFVYGSNALTIEKQTNDTDIYTALVGRGAGIEETNEDTGELTGGYSRKINFADESWSKSSGDPVDKPSGQEYIEWPQATALYGYSDGAPRIGIVDFDNEKDTANLLRETWQQLLQVGVPQVQFKATVGDVGFLKLGETVTIVRYDLDIKYQTRVTGIKWNRKNENRSTITIGDKLVMSTAERLSGISSSIRQAQVTANDANSKAGFAVNNGGVNVNWSEDEPQQPKEGDLWYQTQTDGTIVMKQYEDGQWLIRVDDTTGEQIKNKVDEAVKGVDDAKKSADDAVTKANDAVKNAGLAVTTAKDVKTIANTAQADAAKALADSQISIANASKALDSANSAVTQVGNLDQSVKTQFETVNGQITSKVEKTDYDTLAKTVNTNSTTIKQSQNDILLKADKTDVNTLRQSVVSNTSSISVANNLISQKVSQTDFNNLTGKVSTATAQIDVQAGQISQTVSRLDNLSVGGRNLLKNSQTFFGWTAKIPSSTTTANVDTDPSGQKVIHIWHINSSMYIPVSLVQDEQYTFSAMIRGNAKNNSKGNIVLNIDYGNDNAVKVPLTSNPTYDFKRYSCTFKSLFTTSNAICTVEVIDSMYYLLGSIWLIQPQLERGNVPTDWTPAPEDLATQVQYSSLNLAINQIQGIVAGKADVSQITQLSNSITSTINQRFDDLQIGGTNLLYNTSFKDDLNYWNHLSGTSVVNDDVPTAISHGNNTVKMIVKSGLAGDGLSQGTAGRTVAGQIYTISFWAKASTEILIQAESNATRFSTTLTTEWKYYQGQMVFQTDGKLFYLHAAGNVAIGSVIYFNSIKLEKGNKVTDWTPAPEDNASQVQLTQVQQTLSGIQSTVQTKAEQSQVTQLANQITSTITSANNPAGIVKEYVLKRWFDDGEIGGWDGEYTAASVVTPGSKGAPNVNDGFTLHNAWLIIKSTISKESNNIFNVKPGDKLDFEIWANTKNTDGASIFGVYVSNSAGGTMLLPAITMPSGKELAKYTGSVTIPDGYTKAQPGIIKGGTIDLFRRLLFVLGMSIINATDIDDSSGDGGSSTQVTQLSDAFNLLVRKDNLLSQINVEAGSTLIRSDKIYLDADSVIFSGKAFIPSAAITDLSASKITTGTLDAKAINVINLNGSSIASKSITADKLATNMIRVGLNNDLSGMVINPSDITMYSGGNKSMQLTSEGLYVTNPKNYGSGVGYIRATTLPGHSDSQGLAFDLLSGNDFMTWSRKKYSTDTSFTSLFHWFSSTAAGYKGINTGFQFSDDVTFIDTVNVSGDLKVNNYSYFYSPITMNSSLDIKSYLTVKGSASFYPGGPDNLAAGRLVFGITNITGGEQNMPSIKTGDGQTGIAFGSSEIYMIINNSAYYLSRYMK